MFHLLLLMATTIVSNIAVFSDASGTGMQSHLVYANNQGRWWLFYTDSKTATTVKTMVSSGNDLTTATWSAGTASPAMSAGVASTDQRYMSCRLLNPSSSPTTDAVHVEIQRNMLLSTDVQHIRATMTGSSSISWDTWQDTSETGSTASGIVGNSLGIATDGSVHSVGAGLNTSGASNQWARKASNVDTGATWTNAWGAGARTDATGSNFSASSGLAALASAAMLGVWDNGSDPSEIVNTGLRYNKYVSGTTWPTAGASTTGNGTTSQDNNDWALCGVDTTHSFCVRRSGTNTFDMQMFNGSTWSSKTAPPSHGHKAGSGVFLATDGTNMWMFILDSASFNPVQYAKYTVANDTWDASWTQLEPAGSTARNYISGYPALGNNQIGVIYTAANGSNFDIVLSALNLAPPSGGTAVCWLLSA